MEAGISKREPARIEPRSMLRGLAAGAATLRLEPPPYCRRCGYALEGVADEVECPECGTPVALSRRSNLLEDADPLWLRSVGRGWSVLHASAVLGTRAFYAYAIICLAVTTLGWMLGHRILTIQTSFLAGGILGVSIVVASIGAVIASAPDPRLSPRESSWSARRVMRWSLAAAWTFSTLAVMSFVAPIGPIGRSFAFALIWLSIASFAVLSLSLLRWTAGLADRVPAPKLAQQALRCARIGRWVVAIMLLSLLLLSMAPRGGVGGVRTGSLFFLFSAPFAISVVIGIAAIARTLNRSGKAIVQVLRDVVGEASTRDSGNSAG